MKINLKDKSVLILISVNLFPIIGVFFLHWSYLSVIFLYFLETVIVGIFNIPKMIMAKGEITKKDFKLVDFSSAEGDSYDNYKANPRKLNLFLIPFFLFHYNFFIIIQLIIFYFVVVVFGEQGVDLKNLLNFDFLLSVFLIFGSHLYSFSKNYVKNEEYKKASTAKLMFMPYKRIVIQQLTVIAGTFIIFLINAPVIFMSILIILKIYFDIKSYYKIHSAFSVLEHK